MVVTLLTLEWILLLLVFDFTCFIYFYFYFLSCFYIHKYKYLIFCLGLFVSLKGITFRNCVQGLVISSGNAFDIQNCTFFNNTLNGLRIITNSNINITNCIFSHNAQAVYLLASTVTVSNCKFLHNYNRFNPPSIVVMGYGGLVLKNSYFFNNSGSTGSAVYTDSHAGAAGPQSISISDCEFLSNTANTGTIYSQYSTASFTISRSSFVNNYASGMGGVLFFTSLVPQVVISESNFTNNKASKGGAIYMLSAKAALNSCNFVANGATWTTEGGAIYFEGPGELSVSSSSFSSNIASNSGGGLYLPRNVAFNITNSNFLNNSNHALKVLEGKNIVQRLVQGSTFENNNGSAISLESAQLVLLQSCELSFNKGSAGGGLFSNSTEVEVSFTSFIGNTALNGGAAFIGGQNSSSFYNCTFGDNFASGFGGALSGRISTIQSCRFDFI